MNRFATPRRWLLETEGKSGEWAKFTTFVHLKHAYALAQTLMSEQGSTVTAARIIDTLSGVTLPETFDSDLEDLL